MAPALDLKVSEQNDRKSGTTHATDLKENPVERMYRGNKQGTIKFHGVPKFTDPNEEREWIKVSS